MTGFVIREWRLEPYDGDQAPPHVHHAGEEAFVCLSGDLEVEIDGSRQRVGPGSFAYIERGRAHTFASHEGAHVLAVMSPEIAELIDELHETQTDEERAALWGRCHSEVV